MYSEIYDFKNLYTAFKHASKNKRYRNDVLRFREHLEEKLINIQNNLINKIYAPKPLRSFYVYDPKKRLIQAPTFEDRVVHHALCNIIEPLFERRFIYDSYACRLGKGTHSAVKRVKMFLRPDDYVLKGDISKYFPSINHEILLNAISKVIKCKDTLWLIQKIINVCDDGLPIGALTSQLFANIYLDVFDHYIKDKLGIKRYVRYMDDFVILHKDKNYLRMLLKDIQEFLEAKLQLKLNNKTQIFPANKGIDFCGYIIFKTHLKMRKRNVKKTKKKFKKFARMWRTNMIKSQKIKSSVMSFLGYAKITGNKKTVRMTLRCLLC